MFFKIDPKYFAVFLFLIKLQVLGSATLLKKRLQHRCFSVNIAKILRTARLFDRAPLMATSVSLLFSMLTNQN